MHYVWPLEVLLLFSFGLNRPAQQHQNTIPAAKHERIQTWLRRSLRRPLLTNSYASSFFPRQFRVKPFIASVSAAKKKKDTTLKDEHKKGDISPSLHTLVAYLHAQQTWGWRGFVCRTSAHFCTVCARNIAVERSKVWGTVSNK